MADVDDGRVVAEWAARKGIWARGGERRWGAGPEGIHREFGPAGKRGPWLLARSSFSIPSPISALQKRQERCGSSPSFASMAILLIPSRAFAFAPPALPPFTHVFGLDRIVGMRRLWICSLMLFSGLRQASVILGTAFAWRVYPLLHISVQSSSISPALVKKYLLADLPFSIF